MLGAALATVGLAIAVAACARLGNDWRTASREPVGLAPAPAATPEAVVQVYAARTVGMRGLFGVHSWVAVKPARARAYTVYEVIGWKLRWDDTAVSIREREPDARWFGNEPELLAEARGADAEPLIPRIEAAVKSYPYPDEYRAWPGPNSNTFTAWVMRRVPELRADLPPTAVGKDYLSGSLFASAPSGSGMQLSLVGLLGITASSVEGLEINILGMTFGVDPWPPAIKLPIAGRLGMASGRSAGNATP
ncbi:MAG TPA: DUF3750 domain-containing protein [Burkholderiales bacterium]|nr:DUF3750 domain-containing protein [Burkholderiales bacterium]